MCNTAHQIQSAEQSLNLDTIEITSEITAHTIKNTYTKRAERKAFTQEQMLHLIALNSPLEQKYRDTLQCADRVVECEEIHTGEIKYQTMFCQKRWCAVCNNRRTSHLLKAYTPALDALTDPQLVTLTIPAVPITYKHITEAVDLMFYNFSRAKDRMRKRGYTLSGIRKLESNYNTIAITANPHFHLIVEGAEEAEILQKYWLEYYPSAEQDAQDITPATEGTLFEIFKYQAKQVCKTGVFVAEYLDIIYQAFQGRRTLQSFGSFRKVSVEPQDALEEVYINSQEIEPQEANIEPQIQEWEAVNIYYWRSHSYNWFNAQNIPLANTLTPDQTKYTRDLKRQRMQLLQ